MPSFEKVMSDENRSQFSPMPENWYTVQITDGDVKPTRTGNNGLYIEFTFKVVQGDYMNREIRGRFNIVNDSAKAAEIGRSQLISCADAVGIVNPDNTDDFIGKILQVKIVVKKGEGQYSDSNEIKGYRKDGGFTAPSSSGFESNPVPSSDAMTSKPKWLTKK